MRVVSLEPGHAWVEGRGERRRVNTALIEGACVGEWLLVFLDGARERLTPERAAEVDATLDLVASAMGVPVATAAERMAPFDLPSAWSAADLAALTGQPSAPAAVSSHPASSANEA